MTLSEARIETPIGEMLALASDEGLVALEFVGPRRFERLFARLDVGSRPDGMERPVKAEPRIDIARKFLRRCDDRLQRGPHERVPMRLAPRQCAGIAAEKR